MSTATDALRRQRRLRVIEIAILILGVADLALTAGSFMMILSVAVIALMAYSLRVNVRTVRLIQRTHRPWPDYSAIAAMEQEIWGETFAHEGAPERRQRETGADVAALHAQMDDLAEQATIRRLAACWHCGTVPTLVNGLCPGCYRILKGWGIQAQRPACPQGHPDRRWVEGCGEVCPTCDDARNARSNLRWN